MMARMAGAADLEMNIVLATTHTAKFVVQVHCPDGACHHGSFELKKDLEAEQNFSLELGHLVIAGKRIVEIKIEINSTTTLGARLRSYEWNIATFDSTKYYVFYLGEFKPNNSEDIRLFLRGILTKSVLPELEEHYMYRMTLRKWTTITSSSSRKPIAQIFVSNQKRLEWSSNGFMLKLNSDGVDYIRKHNMPSMVLEIRKEHYMYRMTLRKWTTITSSSSRKPIAQIFVSNQKRLEWSSNGFMLKLNSDGVDYIRKHNMPSMLLEIRKMELDECSVCLELLDKNAFFSQRMHFSMVKYSNTTASIFGGRSFFAYVFNNWLRNRAGTAALPMLAPTGANATTGTALPSPSPATPNGPRRRHRRQQNATHIFQKPRSKRLFKFKILKPVLQNGHGGPHFTYDLWLNEPKTPKMDQKHIDGQTMKVVDTRQKVKLFTVRDIVSTDSQESVNQQQTEPAAVASTNNTSGSSSWGDSDDEESDRDTQPDEQVQFADSIESLDETAEAAAAVHNASPIRPSAAGGEEMNDQQDCMSDRELDAMYKYMQNGDVIVLHGLSPTKRAMIIKFVNDVVKPAEKQMHHEDNDETDEQILLKYLKSGDLKAFKRLKGSNLKKQIEQMMLELGPEDLRDKIAEAIAISRSMVENYSPNQRKASTNKTSGIQINEPPRRHPSYGYGAASDSNRGRGKNQINAETDQEESSDYVNNGNLRNLGRTTQKGGLLGESSNNYADQQNSEYDEAPIESYEEWKRKKEESERQTLISKRNEKEHLGHHEQNKNLSRRTTPKLDKQSDRETKKQSDKDDNNDHLTEPNFSRSPQMERQFRKNQKKIGKSGGEGNESSPPNSEFGDFLRRQNSDQLAERRKRNQVDVMRRNMGNNEMEPYMTTQVLNQCHRRPMIQVMMSMVCRNESTQTDRNRREVTKAEKVTILIRIDE
uniref:Dystrophin-associated glycoprotein 1 n=1 Tax=Globodera pallida TaxID=36090 RepID=A0A183BXA5_GLOPA